MNSSSYQVKKIDNKVEGLADSSYKGAIRKPLSRCNYNTVENRVVKSYTTKVKNARASSKTPKMAEEGASLHTSRYGIEFSSQSVSNTPKSNMKKFSLNDFELGKVLGKGKLGKVYCVRHKESGYVAALKVMSKKDLVELKLEKNFRREIEIQASLQHPNISRLYGYFYDNKNVYLILEYSIDGELYHHLKKSRRFDESTASNYIFQVTTALIYLHSKNIIHRDLKPENILLSSNNQIKLSDFGWSVRLCSSTSQKRHTICGTLDYLPPEMIESNEHDYSVDIWSLGILCYEFLVGKPPFEEGDKNATYRRIAKVDLSIPSFVSSEASNLISSLLKKLPQDRLSLKEVLEHPWILLNKPKWFKDKSKGST